MKKRIDLDQATLVIWMVLLILVPVVRLSPDLFRPTIFANDARIYTFVLWKDKTPTLFQNDPITQYIRTAYTPPGCLAFCAFFAAWFTHPLAAMNILSILLVMLLTVTMFTSGYKLAGKWAGGFSAALILQSVMGWPLIAGSLPKSFATPLVSATLAAWICRREGLALLLQLVSAFVYPPAYALLALTGGLRLLLRLPAGTLRRSDYLLFILVQIMAVTFLTMWIQRNPYGPPITGVRALSSDPHWKGERPRYREYPFQPVASEVLKKGLFPVLPGFVPRSVYRNLYENQWHLPAIAVALLAVLLAVRHISKSRGELLSCKDVFLLSVSAIILYGMARSIPFRLFIPNRYLLYSFPIILSLLVTYLASRIFRGLIKDRPFLRSLSKFLLYLVVFCSIGFEFHRQTYGFGRIPADSVAILRKISRLPEASVIYATGDLANNIPLLCARPVLWNYETYQIFHPSYVKEMDERIRRMLNCLFLTDWESAKKELKKIPVTHLIYDKELWQNPERLETLPDEQRILLSPLWEEYGSKLASVNRKQLLWDHIPEKNLLYDGPRYKLWAVDP